MRARLRRSESIEKAAVSDCWACDSHSHWGVCKTTGYPAFIAPVLDFYQHVC